MEEVLQRARQKMEAVMALVSDDLKGVKTGRAKPSLIEDIKVKAYDTILSLKEVASISAPDPHCLLVSPWDKTILKEIERAIASSQLQLASVIENEVLRIKIAPLTEETRRDLVKLVYQKLESGRKLLRQVRQEVKQELEAQEGQPGISEDDVREWTKELQQLVEEFSEKMGQLAKAKEEELMTV